MTKFADLHIHTHFSDSTLSPCDVVQQAVGRSLAAIAITDHDAVDGIVPALRAAEGQDIEIIPGVELSTEIHGEEIHVLGYFLDYQDRALGERLAEFQNTRVARVKDMIEKLKGLGVDDISLEEVADLVRSNALGRPHLASLLVEKGWVSTHRAAFDKYLGEGRPAYVKKFKQTPQEAIALIREAGGVAVLAHPMVNTKDELIPSFVEAGLGGLEVYYPNTSAAAIQYYEGLARKYGLVMTGGSDAHGENRRDSPIGKTKIPYHLVEELKKRAGR